MTIKYFSGTAFPSEIIGFIPGSELFGPPGIVGMFSVS
jgi:hypothetical protein